MTAALIKYDEACRALAEAKAVDEVKDIRDKADAMRIYARQAKNRDLEIDAAQIRVRAERRLGEMIRQQKATVGLNRGGRPTKTCSDQEQVFQPVTLEDAGIDRKLSSRAQRIAELGEVRFEALMGMMRDRAADGAPVITDVLKIDADTAQRDSRRNLARELSERSAAMPSGRRYPCLYADPPWQRKQGITNRSYENHYPTMTWDAICALPVADMLLPDAWVFLWVPRAHMFALHPVPLEFTTEDGEVITRAVKMPLAWAVARAWGCDSYSTAFVWTKTDQDNPDDIGGGIIVRDQDEILLLFKRGRGLPKPASDEKFGSNHRERPREHSRKPEHYRDMIRTMTGSLPVLELFARVDDAHPLPEGWAAWGNQAASDTHAFAPMDGACCTRGIPKNEEISPCVTPAEMSAADPTCSADAAATTATTRTAGPMTPRMPTTVISSTTIGLRSSATVPAPVLLPGQSDPLDIPDFLRRRPIATASIPEKRHEVS